jgi:WD40 repeat protein
VPSGAAYLYSSHPPKTLKTSQPRTAPQVAHLAEHRRAVNQVAVSSNGAFFVSASNDETVKVLLACVCVLQHMMR